MVAVTTNNQLPNSSTHHKTQPEQTLPSLHLSFPEAYDFIHFCSLFHLGEQSIDFFHTHSSFTWTSATVEG